MDDSIAEALQIKQKALASLGERARSERSRLEHELATIDERARKERATLEEEIAILNNATHIAAATVDAPSSPMGKARTKREREELFAERAEVMRRHLERASGKEVHVRELAKELGRPISTVKDYYSEQPDVRPHECFWENGIDGSHFRWKDSATAPAEHVPARRIDAHQPDYASP